MGAMQQIMMAAAGAGGTGSLDTTAFTLTALNDEPNTAYGDCQFSTDGTSTFTFGGFVDSTPTTPKWWSNTSPPATWMSYSSTGTGGIRGGLTAGTRYSLTVNRIIGIGASTLGTYIRTFTVSFYDASTGGNLLGTKTVTVEIDVI